MTEYNNIYNFLSSNYSINLDNEPTIPIQTNTTNTTNITHITHDLDITTSININVLEAYNGCIKEKVLQRIKFFNKDGTDVEHITHDTFEKICIEIPCGILNNEIITIKNKGNILQNKYQNITGNINISVIIDDKLFLYEVFEFFNIDSKDNIKKYNIYENDHYIKNENDIILYKTITLKEALCGYSFIIPHLSGKIYEIVSKKNIIVSPTHKTTLASSGFNRNNKLGNLIIHYNILFPNKLNQTQLKSIRETL